MRIACLHTAESNIALFQSAAGELRLEADCLRHRVRADLLGAAEAAGGLTPEIAAQTRAALADLAPGTDTVILNCSTLGPSVEGIERIGDAAVIRADEALARTAATAGGRLVVLCTVETTIAPTTALFGRLAGQGGGSVEIRLVPGAWQLFRCGRHDDYLDRIAAAADAAYRDGAQRVVFAQSSMTPAATRVTLGPRPLTPPGAALAMAIAGKVGVTSG